MEMNTTEPYIFLSYSRLDSAHANAILNRLGQYRVWYDVGKGQGGIVGGEEWGESLEKHISDCHVMVALISSRFVNSPYCRREISYAVSKGRPVVPVFLEETRLGRGLDFLLSVVERIDKYKYYDEDEFCRELYACAGLATCKKNDLIDGADEAASADDAWQRESLPFDLKLNPDKISYSVCRGEATLRIRELVIPSEYNGKPITAIAPEAFTGCETIVSVSLPDSIREIGRKAFYCCTGLQYLALPRKLEKIGYCAFWGCVSLRGLMMGMALRKVERFAFKNCASLSLVLYEALAKYSQGMEVSSGNDELVGARWLCHQNNSPIHEFDEEICDDTAELMFELNPDKRSYRVVRAYGVQEASVLRIPAYYQDLPVTVIGEEAFEKCHHLRHLILPDSIKKIGRQAFYCCEGLESVFLSSALTEIGYSAFYGCLNLRRIVAHEYLSVIDGFAFGKCDALTEIFYFGTSDAAKRVNTAVGNQAVIRAEWRYNQ